MTAERSKGGEPPPSFSGERSAGGEPRSSSGERSAGGEPPSSLAERLVSTLRQVRLTIATAESLTAGLISATIADVPGASAVLRGGLTAYATEVKRSCLHLDAELLERHGAISSECAEAMAYQARLLFNADVAVSATGVSGPEQQERQPVGTVYVAVASSSEVRIARLSLRGDRRAIRVATVEAALTLALSAVERAGRTEGG